MCDERCIWHFELVVAVLIINKMPLQDCLKCPAEGVANHLF